MNKIFKILPFGIFLLILLSCSKNESGNKSAVPPDNSNIPDKNVCELMTKEMMSSITGLNFNDNMSTLHQTDIKTGKYVSQCGYYTDSGNMGILIRRFGSAAFPTEKEKLIGGEKTGNTGLDEMMQKALETSQSVNGLGDAAYFYNLGGINNLIIIYKKYYQIHITSYGKTFGFDNSTLETSKKVAAEVIKLLQ